MSVAVETNHFVLLGDVVQERVFVVGEERVGNPDLVGEVSGEGHRVRRVDGEGEPVVAPVLTQADRDGVVLVNRERTTCSGAGR